MNRHTPQPYTVHYIVVPQVWEYFSFYGMHALLILCLTNQLGYGDTHAYESFSAHCLLVYVTSILGGFLADGVLDSHMAVILGTLLMAIGHVVLGAGEVHPSFLYLSLTIIACGYGLSKPNVNCLFGELYESTDPRRDGGSSLMYAAGNMGSVIIPIACDYIQEEYSWAMGFGLAVVDMVAGLVIFLYGNRHLTYTRDTNKKILHTTNFLLPNWGRLLVLLMATPALITILFWKEWSIYVLVTMATISLGILAEVRRKTESQKQRKELGLIVTPTSSNTLFWTSAQQGGSSISLYIDRLVSRDMLGYAVPTTMFQSINASAAMLCGVLLVQVVKKGVAGDYTVRIQGKFVLDFGLMSAGSYVLTLSTRWFTIYGYSSLLLVALSPAVMGFAELFIDPVTMLQITRTGIPGAISILADTYMLFSGVTANYPAGVIADQTSQASFDASGAINYSINAYTEVFDQITWGVLACVGLVQMTWLYQALKFRNRMLALEFQQASTIPGKTLATFYQAPSFTSSYAANVRSLAPLWSAIDYG